ncbi:hypothetical protein JHK85_014269 [Glycine max]|uniref:Protein DETOXIFICATION n=1 Tax=Glycine max TaxID=3847 RepID=I1K5F8_SOYBN|nr:hypothetical protein JHK85_014269 [Glycine max]
MRIVREEVVEEVKRLWLAVPLFSVGILLHILQAISIMFVGHLGTLPLSGASMASSFASVTGFNLLPFYLFASSKLVIGVSYCTGHILWSIKWSRTVPYAWHTHAEIHACCFNDMIPSLFAYGILRCILKFLQTQKIVFPMVLTSGIAAVLHVLFCWLLVFKSGLANRGAALANSISYWVNAILISLYVRFSSACKHSWTGFSKMALHNLLDFLKLEWTFKLMVLMSGLLPNPKLETSVFSICLNTFGLGWMIPFGFSAAIIETEYAIYSTHVCASFVRCQVVSYIRFIVTIESTKSLMSTATINIKTPKEKEKKIIQPIKIQFTYLSSPKVYFFSSAIYSNCSRKCPHTMFSMNSSILVSENVKNKNVQGGAE